MNSDGKLKYLGAGQIEGQELGGVMVMENSMDADVQNLMSDKVRRAEQDPFPDAPSTVTHNFDQGLPAPESFPLAELNACAEEVLRTDGIAACGYWSYPAGRSEMKWGYLALREEIAKLVSQREGREFGADGVIAVSGSSHGLSLICTALLDPGDGAIVEESTYPHMASYMRAIPATVASAPLDDQGMNVDVVEAKLKEFKAAGVRPKIIYTIPTFQVPTGTVMPLERRLRLLELADEYDLIIVEDNCYAELWFDEPPPPSLLSLDKSGRVLQSDSFSKMLAPGLRMGWVTGPPQLVQALAAVRQDLGVGQFIARVLALWMGQGKLRPHVDKVRKLYQSKRDVTAASLEKYCGEFVRYRKPTGGIYFWLELDESIDGPALRALLAERGIACRPGEQLSSLADAKQFLRMSFLQVSEKELKRGVQILGRSMAETSRKARVGV